MHEYGVFVEVEVLLEEIGKKHAFLNGGALRFFVA